MTPDLNGANRTRGPVLRLYGAGESPSSRRAIANLKAICATVFDDRCEVEVLDVLEHAERSLADGVLITPTLIRITPPRRTIVRRSESASRGARCPRRWWRVTR